MTEKIKEGLLLCSFCGLHEDSVDFLIEGSDAHICDNCIAKASEIVKDNIYDDLYGLTFNLPKPSIPPSLSHLAS